VTRDEMMVFGAKLRALIEDLRNTDGLAGLLIGYGAGLALRQGATHAEIHELTEVGIIGAESASSVGSAGGDA
jgi:hypothetical protein